MSEKICSYCGVNPCRCGASDYVLPKAEGWKNGTPFAYMTYVVWPLHEGSFDHKRHRFRFYKGIEFMGDVMIDEREIMDAGIGEFEDPMPYIFDKFERECLVIERS